MKKIELELTDKQLTELKYTILQSVQAKYSLSEKLSRRAPDSSTVDDYKLKAEELSEIFDKIVDGIQSEKGSESESQTLGQRPTKPGQLVVNPKRKIQGVTFLHNSRETEMNLLSVAYVSPRSVQLRHCFNTEGFYVVKDAFEYTDEEES